MSKELIDSVMKSVVARNPNEPEFHQAVSLVLDSISPVLKRHPEFVEGGIIERIVEPDRQIMFRVPWVDDKGRVQVNRGFRVQFNNAIGPYKGGLRLHPSVNLGIIKFLGFEQTFKNALTTLPMGGSKGGSDFDPKGKSDGEVMRFCQSFMNELFRYVSPDMDVPAGDIGVGAREIGFMFGVYKKLTNTWTGVFTGKGLEYGGSLARREATGYGLVYFVTHMLQARGLDWRDKRVVVSGSGNVAIYAVEKAQHLGANVIAMSDSNGYIVDPEGIRLATVKRIKEVERGRIKDYVKQHPTAKYHEGCRGIWSVPCDVALPSATQNEIDVKDAELLVKNGCVAVGEGANMPSTAGAIKVFLRSGASYGPAKAANAGGVSVSGLEMTQNAMHLSWTFDEVDQKLQGIMNSIYTACQAASETYGCPGNLEVGANIAGFTKVARAMMAQGVV